VSRAVKIVGAVAVVLLVAGGAFWYVALRDTAPPEADLSTLDDDLAAGGEVDRSTTDRSTTDDGAERTGLDGNWSVVATVDGFAGYRITELYGPGATLETEVAGRTPNVTGSFAIDGTTITDGRLDVDLTTLESDRSRRDATLKIRGLETDTYPTATFTFAGPVELGALPAEGEEVSVTVDGELAMHGQTRPVALALTAKWSGDRISIQGSTPIVLADYDIEAISIEQFVAVADEGTMEFVVLFERT